MVAGSARFAPEARGPTGGFPGQAQDRVHEIVRDRRSVLRA
jgi:hypothetical protein